MAPIPKPQAAMTDASRFPTTEWYNFWLELQNTTTDPQLQAEIDAILVRIAELEGATYPTLAQGPGIQILGILADGYAQVRLAQLADSGVGAALVKITRDVYGRIAGMEAATAADLPYDNAASGLAATEVQAAIDELASGSSSVFNRIDTNGDARVTAEGDLRITN